jgi:hypothetical protein
MPKKIDDRVNDILANHNSYSSIDNWGWHGCPGPYSDRANVDPKIDFQIMMEIHRATPEECMLSNSDYVTNCKSWLMRKLSEGLIKLEF